MALIGKKTEVTPTGLALVMGNANPLSDPKMRLLVRSAVTAGDYAAVQDAHALAKSLAPPAAELWAWWLDGVEGLARSGDPDLAMFVRFTRDIAGIAPWGNLPAAARQRLMALTP
jgi:hypothetical protein